MASEPIAIYLAIVGFFQHKTTERDHCNMWKSKHAKQAMIAIAKKCNVMLSQNIVFCLIRTVIVTQL